MMGNWKRYSLIGRSVLSTEGKQQFLNFKIQSSDRSFCMLIV